MEDGLKGSNIHPIASPEEDGSNGVIIEEITAENFSSSDDKLGSKYLPGQIKINPNPGTSQQSYRALMIKMRLKVLGQ